MVADESLNITAIINKIKEQLDSFRQGAKKEVTGLDGYWERHGDPTSCTG